MTSEKIHILIVDDDRAHRLLARTILESHFFRVTECSSGPEAIRAVKANSFDLVLLDIVMPEMSGVDVCSELRRHYSPSELPILFLSSKSDERSVILGLEAGANDYIAKPFVHEIFLARIEAQIRMKNAIKSLLLSRERLSGMKRVESIGRITTGICRHFNSLFETVASGAKTIAQLAGVPEPAARVNETIAAAARRGTTLAADLDAFFRTQSHEPSPLPENESAAAAAIWSQDGPCDLKPVITSIVSVASALTLDRIEYSSSLDENLPPARISPAAFSQIIFELITNSIRAISGEGKISIVTAPAAGNATEAAGDFITVTVTDSGKGLDPAEANKLLLPYLSVRKFNPALEMNLIGSGIGLVVAADLARQAGGAIDLVDSGGSGTSLRLSLPVHI